MKTRAWLKISVGLLAATFTALPIAQEARVNIVYINGIKNTMADAESTRMAIVAVLASSENHQGSSRRNFRVESIYNPTGWYGDPSARSSELNQDLMELFLLKTSEEIYADSMSRILLPQNQPRLIDIDAASDVRNHLFDMTPGVTSLKEGVNPQMTDATMAETQTAVFRLVARIRALGSAVVVAHSQGNLLANLAWATLAVEHGSNVGSVMRLVNVANTSKFSVNGLNFTHGGDAALFSAATSGLALTGDESLETLPSRKGWTRNGSDTSNFDLSAAPFSAYTGNINFIGVVDATLKHSIVSIYLSDDEDVTVASNPSNPPSISFSTGRARLVDRFEDFVYAASAALNVSPAPICLASVPPSGTLPFLSSVCVDDGSCPTGQVLQLIGGNNAAIPPIPRQSSCVPRNTPLPVTACLSTVPPDGSIPYLTSVCVDNGSCPAGQVLQLIGGNNAAVPPIPRLSSCVPR